MRRQKLLTVCTFRVEDQTASGEERDKSHNRTGEIWDDLSRQTSYRRQRTGIEIDEEGVMSSGLFQSVQSCGQGTSDIGYGRVYSKM